MRSVLIALFLAGFAAEAHAISRYNSTGMSCAKVQATIRNDGAAIMRYGSKRKPGLPLYGRYVANRTFCDVNEYVDTTTIPAADTPSCWVNECKILDFDQPIRWRRHLSP